MANSISFKWNSSEIDARLKSLDPKIRSRIDSRVRRAAEKAEVDMKIKAPWTQTGAISRWGRLSIGEARDGLYAQANFKSLAGLNRWTIDFGNAAQHGVWLEIAMSGRFAVIMPTMRSTGNAIMASMVTLLDELDVGTEVETGYVSPSSRGSAQGVEVTAGANKFRLRRPGLASVQKRIRVPIYNRVRPPAWTNPL